MDDPSAWVYEDKDEDEQDRHEQERAKNGFSVFDWWNFNSYLDWVIIQGLEKFKNGSGFPVFGGVKTMDDWRSVLDKMIEGFKAHDRLANDWNKKTMEADKAAWEEGSALFIKYYSSLWD